jgi:hypothetical protein
MSSMSSDFDTKRRYVEPREFSSKGYYGKRQIFSHNFHPEFKLDGYGQPGMSYGWQYNGQSMNYESAYIIPQPHYADFSPPQLRSFQELQVERSYLINSLQREDFKATELLKKVRHLQESCHDALEGPVHRKLRKQIGHFKNRMCQCTKQEKIILARLGQVTFEIQSKERWSRIENERLQQWNCHGLEQMRLDAICLESMPYNAYPQQWPVQPIYDGYHYGGYSQQIPLYGGAPKWQPPNIRCESNELHELPCDVSNPISSRVRSASMTNLALPTEKVKRLSMPELSMRDSEGGVLNDCHQYVGFYISRPAQ